jgi:hypothetical protein
MDAGGMGLQLGTDGLTLSNVTLWAGILNLATNIVIYACAAADTQPDNVGTTADGKLLMGQLSGFTGSLVYAADLIQWYTSTNNIINFGGWEGNLWQFNPNGTAPVIVNGAPVELTAVYNGTAP